LVLGGAPLINFGKLEDVGREERLVFGGIAIALCGIFETNGIRVAGNILVGVYSDQGGIDVVREIELLMVDGQPLVRRNRGLSPACHLAGE
jgi:hypothetical protein